MQSNYRIINSSKYIFTQVIDFTPQYQFNKLVKKYKGDRHAKDLNYYNQLLHLLFGQITGCDSIRDICPCLEAHNCSIYHLGIRKSVNQSNLCRANEKRDYRIYEEPWRVPHQYRTPDVLKHKSFEYNN